MILHWTDILRQGQGTEFVLHTDASDRGVGAVLLQGEGLRKTIIYESRKPSGADVNYTTSQKECLTVVWATVRLYFNLYGRHFD